MPGLSGTRDSFAKRFESPVEHAEGDSAARLQALVSPFVLRRVKEDVVTDLPEKIEDTVMAQLTGEQRKLYLANQDRIAQQVQHREASEFKKDKLKVLAELTKLRQICCDPHLHYADYKAGSAKLDTCMELVHGALDGGHRILLFSQFTGMLDIIGKRLAKEDIAFLKLTGASSKESRAKMVAQFQAGEVPVFLISLKAGGVGLNLTAADVVIHYDPWWNVAAQDQATDRAHRIGQQHTVTVYKLIAKDTIEERIMQMQESKRDLVNSVLGGDGHLVGTVYARGCSGAARWRRSLAARGVGLLERTGRSTHFGPTACLIRYVFICNAVDGLSAFGHKNHQEHWHISKGEHHGEIL